MHLEHFTHLQRPAGHCRSYVVPRPLPWRHGSTFCRNKHKNSSSPDERGATAAGRRISMSRTAACGCNALRCAASRRWRPTTCRFRTAPGPRRRTQGLDVGWQHASQGLPPQPHGAREPAVSAIAHVAQPSGALPGSGRTARIDPPRPGPSGRPWTEPWHTCCAHRLRHQMGLPEVRRVRTSQPASHQAGKRPRDPLSR